jgi:hypothetical protein
MKTFLKEWFYTLTGHYSGNVIECKSYWVIQYLKTIKWEADYNYMKGTKNV